MSEMHLALSKKLMRITQRHVLDGEANVCGFHVGAEFSAPGESLEWSGGEDYEYALRLVRLRRELMKGGFEYVGHGHFSVAFRHKNAPGVVFKHSYRTDDAYNAYALWCKGSGSVHAPRIHSVYRGKVGAVYVLKEYVPLRSADIYIDTWEFMRYARRGITRPDRYDYRVTQELADYFKALEEFFDGTAVIDIHWENLMYDPEQDCVIITDPVSFNKEGEEYAS